MSEKKLNTDFDEFGKKEEIVVWKILDTKDLEIQILETHCQLDDSLTYLVLQTIGQPVHTWNVFFWIGINSSADRQCLAALKATELDRYLGNRSRIHREVQNFESPKFSAVFNGKLIYKRGQSQAFLKTVTKEEIKKLYHVKGKKHCRITEVNCEFKSLNQDDVFILDAGDRIFVWNGPHSNTGEKIKGAEVARNIRDFERAGRAQVEFIDQEWDSHVEFFNLLGSKPLPPIHRPDDDEYEKRSNTTLQLYRVSDASGTLLMELVIGKLSYQNLDTNDCFLLDTGSENSGIFTWLGKHCTDDERRGVWDMAIKYLKFKGYPLHTRICTVSEGYEPALFRALLSLPAPNNKNTPICINQLAVVDKDEQFDVKLMHETTRRRKSLTNLVDDGKGTKKVWRIMAFNLVEVPVENYGIFYAGDSYIISYVSSQVKNGIIYYWLGNHSTIDEKGAAAAYVSKIDETDFNGKSVQIRIVQSKEPEHFLKLFDDSMVILKGGVDSGFKSSSRTKNLDYVQNDRESSDVHMYQIRGKRIIEVDPIASNLNSNDIFFIKTVDKKAFTWFGKGANKEEQDTVLKIPIFFGGIDECKTIMENEEPKWFWDLLGGYKNYAKSEILENPEIEFTARLFHCSNARGKFHVEEIVDFNQNDLESDDVMILDAFTEIFVWLGRASNTDEKKSALETVLRYISTDKTGRTEDNTTMLVVKQGFEPLAFKAHFGAWDNLWNNEMSYEQLRDLISVKVDFSTTKLEPIQTVKDLVQEFDKLYPIEILRASVEDLPFGVDPVNKEKHLSNTDFKQVFKMTHENFEQLPKWRQLEHKKRVGLF